MGGSGHVLQVIQAADLKLQGNWRLPIVWRVRPVCGGMGEGCVLAVSRDADRCGYDWECVLGSGL